MSAVPRMTGRALLRWLPALLGLLLMIFLFEIVQAPVIDAVGGAAGLSAIMERIPPALRAFARTRPEFMAMTSIAGYLSLGFTHPLYLVLATSSVIGFAARTLAGEMDRGTIQIALSRPVSRGAVYLSRVIGVLVIALLVSLAGPLGMITGWAAVRPSGEIPLAHFLPLAANTFALCWAAGGLALLGAAWSAQAGRVLGWGLAVFIVMYFVDYFSSIWRIVAPFQPLSLFAYFDPGTILVEGSWPWADLALLAAIGIAAALGGYAVFRSRDLP
jgi:ABC-2 type transport system permease protein